MLLILAVAQFAALPVLVDKFHQFLASKEDIGNTIFASAAGLSVAVIGGASELLSVLGASRRRATCSI